ncbi:MAG: ATPase, T2SS/T4P/T4SS family [Bdellovibrionia bacterium]
MSTPLYETPPWLNQALANPKVTDLCLNGSQSAFLDQGQGLEKLEIKDASFDDHKLREWVIGQLGLAGKTWDAKHPFVDCTLPSGHRLHVAFPPLTRQGILVSLRRLPVSKQGNDSGPHRWHNSPFFKPLAEAVRRGESVLISGSTGSGKTTLISDLLEEIPHSERIIALEDTPELAPGHPHFLTLLSRPPNADGYGEVTLRTLLKQTLRMRPDRIILGECRGSEVLDLLQSLNTGHHGSLATLHANSPRDALRRIELLCLISNGGAIPISAIRELLTLGIQWIAQVKRFGAIRRISELCQVQGREGDTILLRQMLESI